MSVHPWAESERRSGRRGAAQQTSKAWKAPSLPSRFVVKRRVENGLLAIGRTFFGQPDWITDHGEQDEHARTRRVRPTVDRPVQGNGEAAKLSTSIFLLSGQNRRLSCLQKGGAGIPFTRRGAVQQEVLRCEEGAVGRTPLVNLIASTRRQAEWPEAPGYAGQIGSLV